MKSMMERIEQLTKFSLIGEERIAASVDYETCNRCGFRLVRVETTMISEQHITVKHCPICEMFEQEHPEQLDSPIPENESLRYFDAWLKTHGLDRQTLRDHYHLQYQSFFDPV